MSPETITALRWIVVVLALLTAGGSMSVMTRYLVAAWRNGRKTPGRILARHVVEVSAGSAGMVVGYAVATYTQLGGPELIPLSGRLILYIASMTLLLTGIFEVGHYQRTKLTRRPPAPPVPRGRHHRH